MRLRNVTGAKEKIEASKYVILNPKEYKGKWNNIFDNNNKINIEIGMGKGNFIINHAKRDKNINFIGIEKYDSVMIRAIEKIDEKDISNLKLIRMDANEINEVFNNEINVIYLNFSDPWPKNRHENRRLSSEQFLNKYDNIFKNDKTIIMKTDNRKLFEFSIISFVNHGYKIEELSLDLYNDDYKDNIPTEYEIKFSNAGEKIYMVKVTKV